MPASYYLLIIMPDNSASYIKQGVTYISGTQLTMLHVLILWVVILINAEVLHLRIYLLIFMPDYSASLNKTRSYLHIGCTTHNATHVNIIMGSYTDKYKLINFYVDHSASLYKARSYLHIGYTTHNVNSE